ncbi:MAG: permease-like cell division protein FtsX [Bacteroidaceae bacterium]|nr:permease-like cell division protein FtsX [Bacteroidaceae bacterium]MBQ9191971.1 permease-like cell division protein FtsX [Bacteroidaceae bacterium]MBR0243055.1 permease-like cell division protein FtsX [Bacteroidaceae bacterium]
MKKKNTSLGRWQWFTSCVSTTLVLLLLGLVVLFGLTARELSRSVRENLTVTLLLDDDLDSLEARSFQQQIDHLPYAHSTTLITAEQALKEETARMGADPTEFLAGENPYTASIEMNVLADYACTDSLLWISKQLREMWQVSDVIYQRDLVDSLNHRLRQATGILAILAILLTIISIVLINNTVRLSVYARRFSIHTMRLVGASWSVIQRPFLSRSLGIGLTAAILSSALLLGGIHWMMQQDDFAATIITRQTIIIMLATIFAAALLLTLVSTWLCVNHFLHMRENEMYK